MARLVVVAIIVFSCYTGASLTPSNHKIILRSKSLMHLSIAKSAKSKMILKMRF